jgi:hypothetical protein
LPTIRSSRFDDGTGKEEQQEKHPVTDDDHGGNPDHGNHPFLLGEGRVIPIVLCKTPTMPLSSFVGTIPHPIPRARSAMTTLIAITPIILTGSPKGWPFCTWNGHAGIILFAGVNEGYLGASRTTGRRIGPEN